MWKKISSKWAGSVPYRFQYLVSKQDDTLKQDETLTNEQNNKRLNRSK